MVTLKLTSLLELVKLYKYWVLLLCVLVTLVPVVRHPYLVQKINGYAIKSAEDTFGSKLLAPEQEEMINAIARRVGVTQYVVIRKMNHHALSMMGYYNAFVIFPSIFNCIPIGDVPFLFVSEGFFEDLSSEERLFLIGHEMVHVREQHTRYFNLIQYLLLFLICCLIYFLHIRITRVQKRIGSTFGKHLLNVIVLVTGISCFMAFVIIGLAYRRHIEWVADEESLKILKSYEGCMKLLNRWDKEFKMPHHNDYWGMFSSHPSLHERRVYCLDLQHSTKD